MLVALLVLPASASASSTVFGDDLSHDPHFSSNNFSTTNVIKPDGSPDTGSPVSGVLVSVRVRTTGGGGSGVVRVLRQISHPDAATYVFRNTSPEIPVSVLGDLTTAGHITEVQTRRPIAAGDRLGLHYDDPSGNIIGTWNDAGGPTECAFTTTPHMVDNDLTYSTFTCNNNPILAQGTVETDADGDGFGDDTQDACPTSAATQGACPVAPSTAPTPPSAKKKKCKKKKHKKRSAGESKKKKCKKKKRR